MTPTETTVKDTETTVTDGEATDRDPGDGLTGWFAASSLRIGLALVGLFLLLAALGQLSGIDLIGLGANLLNTGVGRWLLVAVVAIALIVVAVHGFDRESE